MRSPALHQSPHLCHWLHLSISTNHTHQKFTTPLSLSPDFPLRPWESAICSTQMHAPLGASAPLPECIASLTGVSLLVVEFSCKDTLPIITLKAIFVTVLRPPPSGPVVQPRYTGHTCPYQAKTRSRILSMHYYF